MQDAIYHNAPPPLELLKYQYRKVFHLSAKQMDAEPASDFFTNLMIYGYIQDMKRLQMEKNK